VDDIEMRITHVIRGEDHLANTCKQLPLFEALGAPLPVFAHLPMIHNEKGEKISKRRDPVAVTLYQGCGLLPEAFFNFLALLGWSPGDNRELLSKAELLAAFSLERVNKSPAQFALKRHEPLPPEATEAQRVDWLAQCLPGSKLEWMNGEHLKRLPLADACARARPFLAAAGYDADARPTAWLEAVVKLGQERARTLRQLAEAVKLFFVAPERYDAKAVEKFIKDRDGLATLRAARARLDGLKCWEPEGLKHTLEELTAARQARFGDVAQPIRVALAGAAVSPPIHETLAVLGRDESLRRVDRLLAALPV
jgi:glutamyl/glutaminyl-tRNA synthetase